MFFRFEKTTTHMSLIFPKSIGILVFPQNMAGSLNFSILEMSCLMFLLGLGPFPFQQQEKTAQYLPMISTLSPINGCCTIVS